MLGVDLTNFPKFPRVDDSVTYPKGNLDIRQQLDVDSGAELPDYGAPTGRTCGSPTSILAIPPRKDPGDVCCKWRFSMRTEDDPASSRWS